MADLHPLRAYRTRQNPPLSQEKLGELVGVTKFAISKWESGSRNIDPRTAEKIEEITGIDARVLLGIPKRVPEKRGGDRCKVA